MATAVKTSSPRRSGRFRKECSFKDNVLKPYNSQNLNFSSEETTSGRLVYHITKGDTKPSIQFPRVLISFAAASNTFGDGSNKNIKERSSAVANATPDETITREGGSVVANISGSDTDEINYVHDVSERKRLVIGSRRPEANSDTVVKSDNINYKPIENDTDVKSSTKGRLERKEQTAAVALDKNLGKIEMKESTTTISKSPACTFVSKNRKIRTVRKTIHNKNKKNRIKEKPTKIIKMHTGTLYLYRGLNARAEFVRRR